VLSVCAVMVDGRMLLASAGNDATVRLWDPGAGAEVRRLDGHTGWVQSVCAVTVDGQTLLASAGDDETVRLWDPGRGRCRSIIPVHHSAFGCADIGGGGLVVGLDVGVLVVDVC
jgi:WD40 repeat protein